MTDPVKTCVDCGHTQPTGEFCEACGARLPMEGFTAAEAATASAAASAPPVGAVAALLKTCAICGHTQATGEFCEACGTRLPMEGLTRPAPAPGEAPGPAATPGAAAAAAGPAPGAAPAGAAFAAGAPPYYGAQPAPQPGMPPTPPPPGMGYAPLPTYPSAPGTSFWSRFFDLSFERFITPSIIKVLFVIAIVVIGLSVLGWIIWGFIWFGALGIFTLIGALIAGFIYLLLARVFLEMVVVFFRIRDDTEELVRLKR